MTRRPPGGSPWAEDGAFFHGAHPGGGAGRGQSKNRGGPPAAGQEMENGSVLSGKRNAPSEPPRAVRPVPGPNFRVKARRLRALRVQGWLYPLKIHFQRVKGEITPVSLLCGSRAEPTAPPSAWARRVPAGPAGKPDLGLKLTFGAQRIEAVILGEAAHPPGAEPDG